MAMTNCPKHGLSRGSFCPACATPKETKTPEELKREADQKAYRDQLQGK